MNEQKPSVGRIVHIGFMMPKTFPTIETTEVPVPYAAIITRVHDDGVVDVTVFDPYNLPATRTRVPYAEKLTKLHWSWPLHG